MIFTLVIKWGEPVFFSLGVRMTAGRVISGARSHERALPSRTDAALSFSSWRNAGSARVLTGTELNAVRPTTRTRDDYSNSVLQLPPMPARFFFCPRRNALVNTRGLRLAWLLGINDALK